jgi:Flp pilus assembly protein TadD
MEVICMLPFEEAVEKINKVLKQNPENADMWCSLGVALIELKRYDKAAEKFEKAAELNPQLPSAWYGWGIALKALGQDKAAAEKIKTAMEIDQDGNKDPSEPEK